MIPSYRFWPDLILQALAVAASFVLLRVDPRSRVLRLVAFLGSPVLIAGFILTYFESLGYKGAFRWMMVSGLAFAWSGVVVATLAIALLRKWLTRLKIQNAANYWRLLRTS